MVFTKENGKELEDSYDEFFEFYFCNQFIYWTFDFSEPANISLKKLDLEVGSRY
jgi:hypothetical protein